jgi:hypothetical protein
VEREQKQAAKEKGEKMKVKYVHSFMCKYQSICIHMQRSRNGDE